MTQNLIHNDAETLLRRSLHAITVLEDQLKEKEKSGREPVAVIGMACRFPGGCTTPESYWDFLKEKGDGIIDIPPDRWNIDEWYDPDADTVEKMYIRQAGFLQENIGEFDARFFRISPLEAAETDPQHRMLLEVGWEALESAGQNPDRLKGSRTGVFIGIIGSEYAMLPRDLSKMNLYAGTGTLNCIASGRISHTLGFQGPALSIDTACSSSLVSVHYACESLRKGECDMALAGGVNAILAPLATAQLCMFGALAKDGRCKPFDANGDGYGRGEGCGLVLLKRLSDAQREKDPIFAVIQGGAVNNDGPGSGLTVPNGAAQEAVIREALKNAATSPDRVTYIEAHGTGTSLGDPIEFNAMTRVFGEGRSAENPLFIGSVKGNIGHLEGAAGIAGLIKAVLCLHHGQIPPNAQLKTLNPKIRPDKVPAVIPTETAPWNRPRSGLRTAGISAFGFSGTNAHLILSEAPPAPEESPRRPQGRSPLHIMAVSARSQSALHRQAARYKAHWEANPDQHIGDICYTANAGRAHFSERAALIAGNRDEILEQLAALSSGNPDNAGGLFQGSADEDARPKIAFLFSGDTENISGMARELYDALPSFQRIVKSCDEYFTPYLKTSLLNRLYPEPGTREPEDRNPQQLKGACRFTLEYGLARLWESWGIRPSAVLGEGVGIYAAACIAGVMTPETAAVHIAGDSGHRPEQTYQGPRCRFISPDSGKPAKKSDMTKPSYWQQAFEFPMAFEQGAAYLHEQGYRFFMETGPRSPERQERIARKNDANYLPCIRSDETRAPLLEIAARLYCAGADLEWKAFAGDFAGRIVNLPTYPFEGKRYWIALKDESAGAQGPETEAPKPMNQEDLLTGTRVRSILGGNRFEYHYRPNTKNLPELKDVEGILHVGYYYEILSRAAEDAFQIKSYVITETEFSSALILTDSAPKTVGLLLEPGENGAVGFRFCSRGDHSREWDTHVSGTLAPEPAPAWPENPSIDEIKKRCTQNSSGLLFYQMMRERGIELGFSVQWVEEIWYREGEALARFRMPAGKEKQKRYHLPIHPGMLDACAQIFHAALPEDVPADMSFMVVQWDDILFSRTGSDSPFWCHVSLEKTPDPSDSVCGTLHLFDPEGAGICRVGKSRMKGLSREQAAAFQAVIDSGAGEADRELIDKLADAPFEEKKAILGNYVQKRMAEILNIPIPELDMRDPLRNLGMDSLVGLRFKTAADRALEMNIPMDILLEGPSLFRLTETLLGLLGYEDNPAEAPEPPAGTAHGEKGESGDSPENRWFCHRKIDPEAKLRLFCLPYGGGGASIYRRWQEKMPDDIEVCPIQLPGRENRIRERLIEDIHEMTDLLESLLKPELDRPYALYGHSMGALIAFRLAYRLWQNHEIKPLHLFVGGYASPSIYPNPSKGRMPEDRTMIPEGNGELLEALQAIFCADTKIVESYKPDREDIFDIPITAFHGENENLVRTEETKAWRGLTTAPFKLHILPGDHLFVNEDQSQEEVIRRIVEEIHTRNTRRSSGTIP